MSSKKIIDLRGKRPVRRELAVRKANVRARSASPARRNRLRTRALALSLGALCVAGSMWGISYLSYLPQLTVHTIEVRGTSYVSPRVVQLRTEQALYDSGHSFLSPLNVLLVSTEEIKDALESSLPRIKRVQVSRESLVAQTITIEMQEREAYASWCRTDFDCYLVDDNGYIYARRSNEYLLNQYVFSGGVATSTSPIRTNLIPGQFSHVKDILYELFKEGYAPTHVHFDDDADMTVTCPRFTLKIARDADSQTVVRNLTLTLSSEALQNETRPIEYIDLRFGNRIYFKTKEVDSLH